MHENRMVSKYGKPSSRTPRGGRFTSLTLVYYDRVPSIRSSSGVPALPRYGKRGKPSFTSTRTEFSPSYVLSDVFRPIFRRSVLYTQDTIRALFHPIYPLVCGYGHFWVWMVADSYRPRCGFAAIVLKISLCTSIRFKWYYQWCSEWHGVEFVLTNSEPCASTKRGDSIVFTITTAVLTLPVNRSRALTSILCMIIKDTLSCKKPGTALCDLRPSKVNHPA